MARTLHNGRSPGMTMSDFNARVKRLLEGSEEITRGPPKASPNWNRRRPVRPPVAAEVAEVESPAADEV